MRYTGECVGQVSSQREGLVPVSRLGVEALLSVGRWQVLVRWSGLIALDWSGSVLELLLRCLVLWLRLRLRLLRGSILLTRGLVLRLWSSVLLGWLLLVICLWTLEGRVLWPGGSFSKQFGVQIVSFLQLLWQWWWSGQMISDRLETTGISLVLNAVQFSIWGGVGVSSGNDLFSQLGSNFAIVALFLVLDAITGGVVKPIASITVVHVFVSQNRDGGGTWLLEASLESTSGLVGTGSAVRLRLLWL